MSSPQTSASTARHFELGSSTIDLMMDETEAITETFIKELSEMHRENQDRMEEMIIKHEGVQRRINSQRKQLNLREKVLGSREVRYDNEKRELLQQQRMNELADEEQKQVHKNLMRLAEKQQKEKDAFRKKFIELEKKRNLKRALELEVECLKGAVNIMGHMGDEEDVEAKEKMKATTKKLKKKAEELDSVEVLNQPLITKEEKASEEVQEALKALTSGLQSVPITKGTRPSIGVKKLGELDSKPFLVAAQRKYSAAEVDEKAAKWWSEWESYVKDTNWRPFKTISKDAVTKEVIDEENELLKELRNEVSEEAYNAVVTSIIELNDYSPQDRTPRLQLWNFKEERPSNLCEGVAFLLKNWKLARKKK